MACKILCIIDGATDEHYCINDTLQKNLRGYFQTTPEGYETESSTCIFNLLGVSNIPKNSRAWFEAMGLGIALNPDDLVLRTSMVHVKKGIIKTLTNQSDAIELPDYYSLGGYKGVLVFRHGADRFNEIRPFPVHQHMGDPLPEALGIVQPLKAQGIYLVPWAPSVKPDLAAFPIKGVAITGIALVKGMSQALGLEIKDNESFTGDVDTNLTTKIEETLVLAQQYPFVLLHINGADEAGHRMDEPQKRVFREQVVQAIQTRLMVSEHQVLVTSDHGTSVITGKHMNIKQPYYTNFESNFKEKEGIRKWLKQ